MLVKTDAIILKSMKYRDTSKIVTMYTREYGKLQCLAKGARNFKNKFGASLEPLSYSHVVFYKKEHRDLHLLSQGSVLTHFKKLTTSLLHLSLAFGIAEVIHKSTPHEEKNTALFELVLHTLQELNATNEPEKYFYAFQIQWSSLLGFAPSLDACARCGSTFPRGRSTVFYIEEGTVLCRECVAKGTPVVFDSSYTLAVPLSAEALETLRFLARCSFDSLKELHIAKELGNEIEKAVRFYIQYHHGHTRPLQTMELLHRL